MSGALYQRSQLPVAPWYIDEWLVLASIVLQEGDSLMSGPDAGSPAKSGGKMKLGTVLLFVLWNVASFFGAWWLVDRAKGTLRGVEDLKQGIVYEVLAQTKDSMGGDIGYLAELRSLPPRDAHDEKPGDPRWYALPSAPPDKHFVVVVIYGKQHLMKDPEGR